MSKQLHTVFLVPAPEKQALRPIKQQNLQELITEMKKYLQEASTDLLQPRNEVMEKLFQKVLH